MPPHDEDEAWRTPTVVSLREYVDQRLDAAERTVESTRKALADQVQQRFEATQQAITAAERTVENARAALASQVQQRFEATEQAIHKADQSVSDRLQNLSSSLSILGGRVELFITRQEVAVLLEKFDQRNAENIQRQLIDMNEKNLIQGAAIRKELDLWKEGLREQLRLVNMATDKAAEAMDRRLETMNEFRAQLRDQTGTFITRIELKVVADKIDALQASQNQAEGRRTITTALVAFGSSLIVTLLGGIFYFAVNHK